jgi:hypothetical protein
MQLLKYWGILGMGKKRNKKKQCHEACLAIYEVADLATYVISSATIFAALHNGQVPTRSCALIVASALSSTFLAANHNSSLVKKMDQLIGNININLRVVIIDKSVIGSTYSILNNITKSFIGFAFTSALTPGFTEVASTLLASGGHEFLAGALGLSAAAAAATTMVYLFNRFEAKLFGIKGTEFEMGVAGTSQIRFLERAIFNGVNQLLPMRGYLPAACAGLATTLLSSAYSVIGLESSADGTKAAYKNPAVGILANMGSRLSNMVLERAYIAR